MNDYTKFETLAKEYQAHGHNNDGCAALAQGVLTLLADFKAFKHQTLKVGLANIEARDDLRNTITRLKREVNELTDDYNCLSDAAIKLNTPYPEVEDSI